MGTTLIFVGQWKVTRGVDCMDLLDCLCSELAPGNSLHIRPYPKPTQVDW